MWCPSSEARSIPHFWFMLPNLSVWNSKALCAPFDSSSIPTSHCKLTFPMPDRYPGCQEFQKRTTSKQVLPLAPGISSLSVAFPHPSPASHVSKYFFPDHSSALFSSQTKKKTACPWVFGTNFGGGQHSFVVNCLFCEYGVLEKDTKEKEGKDGGGRKRRGRRREEDTGGEREKEKNIWVRITHFSK